MSVRNIDQGFYSVSSPNMLKSILIEVGATDSSLFANTPTQVFQNNQQITLIIPPYSHTFTGGGSIQINLPPEISLETSTNTYNFPIIISDGVNYNTVSLVLNVSSGQINIYGEINQNLFPLGQFVGWLSPIIITYILN